MKTCREIYNFLQTFRNKNMPVKAYLKRDGGQSEIKIVGNKNINIAQFSNLVMNRMLDAGNAGKPSDTLKFISVFKQGAERLILNLESYKENQGTINFYFTT